MEQTRKVGTVSRGIRCPIIREGDDLAAIVTESVLEAAKCEGFELRDRDVISMTESIVARAQGNYCSVQNIADDVRAKLGGETVGVIFPILSRNRFAICLRGIAMGCKKVVLMLSYPSDEVGNELVSLDQIDAAGINPYGTGSVGQVYPNADASYLAACMIYNLITGKSSEGLEVYSTTASAVDPTLAAQMQKMATELLAK